MSCAICLDGFALPVALPCGHVFCQSCLVNSIIASPAPACPTCRRPYPTASLDPSRIPPSLRPYILPPFRRLYLDNACPRPAPSAPPSLPSISTSAPPHASTSALAAENAALRTSLRRLRAHAEQHAAARAAAAAFARATAACALAERGRLARLKWRVRAYDEGRGWDGRARAMVIPDTGEAASLWQGGTGVDGV